MYNYYMDSQTAYRVYNELNIPIANFSASLFAVDKTTQWAINPKNRKLYSTVRAVKPDRKLNYNQVAELLLLPSEAWLHYLASL